MATVASHHGRRTPSPSQSFTHFIPSLCVRMGVFFLLSISVVVVGAVVVAVIATITVIDCQTEA